MQKTVGIGVARGSVRTVGGERSVWSVVIRVLLVAYVVLGFVSIVGYGAFVLRPENLALFSDYAWVQSFYAVSFSLLAQFHIGLAFVVLCLSLFREYGLGWIASLLAVAVVTLAAELIGTTTGFPFGAYSYSGLLGPKILQHVPVLIPISWFVVAVPAYVIARHRFPGTRRVPRLILGATLLTSWDLSLDPAMSYLASYWIWEQPGIFYGMPLINLAGWFITSLLAMVAVESLGPFRESVGRGFVRRMVVFYCATLLLPVGLVAVAGLWSALLLGTLVPLLCLAYSKTVPLMSKNNF